MQKHTLCWPFSPPRTQNSWSQTTLVTISCINGPRLYCWIWYLVFLQITVFYYFSEFYTSARRTWINNRHHIPPSFKTEEGFLVLCQFGWTQEMDQDFMSSFPLSTHHQSFGAIWILPIHHQRDTQLQNISTFSCVPWVTFAFPQCHCGSELNTEYSL